jgi:flavodoxin
VNTTIYYFTGTGNSLAVSKDLAAELLAAKLLAAELNDRKHSIDILPIAKFDDQDSITVDAEVIGIVFPVYCLDVPSIVKAFVWIYVRKKISRW